MKYEPHVQHLETEGFGETRDYRIAATGKAFRNLMDGLYGRKIEAVVRELCTNAQDSHVEAGCPGRQFHMSLPTEFRARFAVRDYGVGMPHAQVMDRYSTLFDSTKDQSNTQTGMLGLGSKSPFAYTDGFTLRCWDGQECRTYASYLGEGGVPMISVADVQPSTEPRGVEVSFPVKRGDVQNFAAAATRVLKGFATHPAGIPEQVRAKLITKPYEYGEGWAVTEKNWLPNDSKIWALQGNVLYPVDLEAIEEEKTVINSLTYLENKVVLEFPIGSLEFTPGRETLSMTPRTVSALKQKWAEFRFALNEKFRAQFADCPTNWHVAVRATKENLSGLFGGLFKLSGYAAEVTRINSAVEDLIPHYEDYKSDPEAHPLFFVSSDGEPVRYRASRRRRERPRNSWSKNWGELVFVEQSTDVKAPWKRVGHNLKLMGRGYAVAYRQDADPQEIKDALEKLGNPPVLKLKDLPHPPPSPRSPGAGPTGWVRYRTLSKHRGWVDADPEDGDTEELLQDARHLFVYDGMTRAPHAHKPISQWEPVMNLGEAARLARMEEAAGNPAVVLVRLRANEVWRRFKHLPLYTSSPDKIAAELNNSSVMTICNLLNLERFGNSIYSDALNNFTQAKLSELRGARKRGLRKVPWTNTPFDSLRRFEHRLRRIKSGKRSELRQLMELLGPDRVEGIAERAVALGCELLPQPDYRSGLFHENLLPLQWENLARMLSGKPYSLGVMIREMQNSEKCK